MKLIRNAFMAAAVALAFSFSASASVITNHNIALPDVATGYPPSNVIQHWFTTGIFEHKIDSITINAHWRDQGYGNKKGRIFFQINAGPWVFVDLAEHFYQTESWTFNGLDAAGDSTITLGYTVGHGGGHALYIDSASLEVTTVPAPLTALLLLSGLALLARNAKVAS